MSDGEIESILSCFVTTEEILTIEGSVAAQYIAGVCSRLMVLPMPSMQFVNRMCNQRSDVQERDNTLDALPSNMSDQDQFHTSTDASGRRVGRTFPQSSQ